MIAPAERVPVDVAVGVLIDAEGRFLLTSRPAGKVYAGYWEFPGGKLEVGESVEQALRRELHEELGITIGAVKPWQVELVDYPHALRASALLQGIRVDGRVRDARASGHGVAVAAGRGFARAARHLARASLVCPGAGLCRRDLRAGLRPPLH